LRRGVAVAVVPTFIIDNVKNGTSAKMQETFNPFIYNIWNSTKKNLPRCGSAAGSTDSGKTYLTTIL